MDDVRSTLFQPYGFQFLFPIAHRNILIVHGLVDDQFHAASPFQALQFCPLPFSVPTQACVTFLALHVPFFV